MCVLKKISYLGLSAILFSSSWSVWSIPTFYSKKPVNYHGPYYLQVTACHHRAYALDIAKKYKNQNLPVKIKHSGNFYTVILGPLNNQNHSIAKSTNYISTSTNTQYTRHKEIQVHAPSRHELSHHKQSFYAPSHHTPLHLESYTIHHTKNQNIQTSRLNNWYAEITGGVAFPMLNSSILIDNGSGFPAPQNVDTYTTNGTPTQGTFTILLGKRFPFKHHYLKDFSLGLRYQYLAPTNVGNTITQYTLSQFYNYNYELNSSVNALTIDGKLRTKPYHYFMPFLHAGLGISFNNLSSYQETALPPVTTRISPNFAGSSSTQFTFHAGAGTEVQIEKNLNFVVSYEYGNYGPMSTGPGVSTWSGGLLNIGAYQTNTVLFGLNYTMD